MNVCRWFVLAWFLIVGCANATANLLPRSGFIPNAGQWPARVHFTGLFSHASMVAESDGLTIGVPTSYDPEGENHLVRLAFVGDRAGMPQGEDRLPGVHHFFLGRDPARWARDVPWYGGIIYRDVVEGIDVVIRCSRGTLEYDLRVAAGADLEALELVWEGADRLVAGPDGSVDVQVGDRIVRQGAPRAWEETPGGNRRVVPVMCVLVSERRIGFRTPGRSWHSPLVVDPPIEWGTYLTGAAIADVAMDAAGRVLLAGFAGASFSTSPGAFQTSFHGMVDCMVARLSPDGANLQFATWLGGANSDRCGGMALTPEGDVVVAGFTYDASTFPITSGSFQSGSPGLVAGFVTRLAADGSALVFSSILAGSTATALYDVEFDAAHGVTVTGENYSSDYPVTPNAYDVVANGTGKGLVTRLTADGSALTFSTFLGGTGLDQLYSVATFPDGSVTVVGKSTSVDFPLTPGAFSTVPDPAKDQVVVCHLSADGQNLLGSTFLGSPGAEDKACAVRVHPTGNIVLMGDTFGVFPTTPGAFEPNEPLGLGDDLFVSIVSPDAKTLVASTYLGGGSSEAGCSMAFDAAGAVLISGTSWSANFPTTAGAWAAARKGPQDAVVTRLDSRLAELWYSSYVGGSEVDGPAAVAVHPEGGAVLFATTTSLDAPITPGTYQPMGKDTFVVRMSLLPVGADRYGTGTAGCAGVPIVGVDSVPSVGKKFALTCHQAPPQAAGLLGISSLPLGTPLEAQGALLWLDPQRLLLLPVKSDGTGCKEVQALLAAGVTPPGFQAYLQFFWQDACAPFGYAASSGLALTIQP